MRRGPKEDDREQRDRAPADLSCCRRPADYRWKGACSAADYDVLRSTPLQPYCIYEDIEEDGRRQQSGRREVRRINASISRSYHMFMAPAEPAPTAMHNTATAASTGWRCPGATLSPTSPVKTTSAMTRGFRIS